MNKPQKYRRKPTEPITAIQWTWTNIDEVKAFVGVMPDAASKFRWSGLLWVDKSRAWCEVANGAWIIAEPDGTGFYPCSADVFEASYELIDEM